jgi:5-formyltetrahydrofolate cyclo-ligase
MNRKQIFREQAQANRDAQPDKDELSRRICDRFLALPAYAASKTVLFYIDVRSEVRTRPALPVAIASGKKIVVPWCNDRGELELFHLTDMNELVTGMYGILEPKPEIRSSSENRVMPEELDLVMVPGVAFDRAGGRLGHGTGYYDKLLRQVRPDALLVALAFECQLFDEIPMDPHDIFMDMIITEAALYMGRNHASASAAANTASHENLRPGRQRVW